MDKDEFENFGGLEGGRGVGYQDWNWPPPLGPNVQQVDGDRHWTVVGIGFLYLCHPPLRGNCHLGAVPWECHARSTHTVQSFVYILPKSILSDSEVRFTSPTGWYLSVLWGCKPSLVLHTLQH